MKIRAVILDFDGVVNDSFQEGLRRIKVLAAIHDVAFTRESRMQLTQLWGIPGKELLARGLGVTETLADTMYVMWEKMDATDPVALIPGAKEALYWLKRNDFRTALLTTRNRQNILDIFERLDLLRSFDVLSTRQDAEHRKPDPRAFRFVLEESKERFGLTEKDCIFIGDTREDIAAGHAAGIETLVVQTGPYLLRHAKDTTIKLENVLGSIDDLPFWIEEHHDGEIKHPYI